MSTATIFFLILLRMAIGWHLLYEGFLKHKAFQTPSGWSSEAYLRYATGPLKGQFRESIGDFYGETALDSDAQAARWSETVAAAATQLGLNAEEKTKLDDLAADLKVDLDNYLAEYETRAKRDQYLKQIQSWRDAESGSLTAFEVERLRADQQAWEATRRELTAPVKTWTAELRAEIDGLATEKLAEAPVYQRWLAQWSMLSRLEQVDRLVTYGLMASGFGLLIGLFSRLSAFVAACLLFMFYISMPPWPGLPPNPQAEGNYLIVNKNLIEMLACLALATTRVGVWGGVDAIIRGLITRPLFGLGKQEIHDRAAEEADDT